MINPKAMALEHKFTTVDVGWHDYVGWVVTVHGRATGEFGCNVGSGAAPESALADARNKVRNYREDRAAIAAVHRAAKAMRIADLTAELASPTGLLTCQPLPEPIEPGTITNAADPNRHARLSPST